MESSTESFVLVGGHSDSPGQPLLSVSLNAPSPTLYDSIRAQRQLQPDGQLAIEHLLQLAFGPEADQVEYPPANQVDVDSLVAQLDARATADQPAPLTARSCLYYLALALTAGEGADDAVAAAAHEYAQDVLLLPLAFRLAVQAFFALDSARYKEAVSLLVHPAVTPDFVPRTLALLATRPEPASDRARLVLNYWTLAQLDLAAYSVNEAQHVVRALCAPERKRGVVQAWNLAREWHVEQEQPALWTAILDTCFGGNYSGQAVPQHLSALLAMPFSPAEDALVTSFCLSATSSRGKASSLAVDWRLSKLVAESRSVEALEFYARAKHAFANRGEVARLENDARDRLLKAVEANLTAVEKARLQLELASISGGGSGTGAPGAAAHGAGKSASLATLTQPAWAPVPAQQQQQEQQPDVPLAGSSASMISMDEAMDTGVTAASAGTTKVPPRTLAELRQQRLPPAPAPALTAADLPLSASPFVRRQQAQPNSNGGRGGGSDVLRALQQQHTPRKAGPDARGGNTFSGPLGVTNASTGSPFRLHALSNAGSTLTGGASEVGTVRTTTAASTVNSGLLRSAASAEATPVKAKPTLPGFGSVRKPVAPASVAAAQQVAIEAATPRRTTVRRTQQQQQQQQQRRVEEQPATRDGEDADMEGVEQAAKPQSDEEDFARRAARDPAVQRTIQAASKPREDQKNDEDDDGPAAAEAGSSKRGATPARRTTRRADKRRAVQGQPPNEDKVDASRTEEVRLPPGAFPGQEDEDDDDTEADTGRAKSSSRPSAKGRMSSSASAATKAAAAPATPARGSLRRTTRSRASTAEPASPPPTRRSTRASSVQADEPEENASSRPEMRQVHSGASIASATTGKTPVRRSSRLRSGAAGGTKANGGDGKIDEASEEE